LSPSGFDAGANRLGALALRLTDRMALAVTAETGLSLSAATALSAIDRFFADPPSIDALRRVIGLTPSGGVRLVDGLEAQGLVRRSVGRDGRVRVVELTAEGRGAQEVIVRARRQVLIEALAPLSSDERDALAQLVERVLIGLVQGLRPGPAMCRLCATEVCGAQPGQPCPITRAALGG
jgi:MarR family transcriptional regulator, negative regulator of the multidrug operon emrRAB